MNCYQPWSQEWVALLNGSTIAHQKKNIRTEKQIMEL